MSVFDYVVVVVQTGERVPMYLQINGDCSGEQEKSEGQNRLRWQGERACLWLRLDLFWRLDASRNHKPSNVPRIISCFLVLGFAASEALIFSWANTYLH